MSESELIEEITDAEVESLAQSFNNSAPEEVLRWAVKAFESDVALATAFGPEGCVLIDMLCRVERQPRIFYLDTDLFFPETYELIDQLAMHYQISFERQATDLSLSSQAQAFGPSLWEREPDRCCQLRKVEPLLEKLAGLRAWITAIRRDQSSARAAAQVIERDPKFGLIKINPLVGWSPVEVWKYIFKHNVPYNPLHDQGFPSIGCAPCTTAVQPGEDPRAGRWRGCVKRECGLHQ
jgi:phosphoadenosine phosphosulfate reductase